ncbi:hypothetical protein Y032_0082g1538 [Ancylostoma ceylanicum]|uniref:Uncharacterized protein n=1 Tax=Ancylostoma ceylanicum TaxID=53326 RepID=A0A016TRG4_9BILA|nr:hypothetical protein Y032_0082g1538 [Ancylostoma ceylanicum]
MSLEIPLLVFPDKPSEFPRRLPNFGTSAELGLLQEQDFRNFRGNMTSLINFIGTTAEFRDKHERIPCWKKGFLLAES